MSLINDALKRAKQVQPRPAPPILAEPNLQPAEAPLPVRVSASKLVPIAAIGLLLLSFWFFFLWWRQSEERTLTVATKVPQNQQLLIEKSPRTNGVHGAAAQPAPAVVASSAVVAQPEAAPARVRITPPAFPTTNAVADPNTPAPVPTRSGPEEEPAQAALAELRAADPPPPDLKVDGIFYRKTDPSAIINGRALFVGDEIDGAKVLAIERDTVRMRLGSRTLELKRR